MNTKQELNKKIDGLKSQAGDILKDNDDVSLEEKRLKGIVKRISSLGSQIEYYKQADLCENGEKILKYSIKELSKLKQEVKSLPEGLRAVLR